MSNISTMVQMIFRYAIFIVFIIILLIIGLMFFYFTNQITYQNNKINTMFGIVTDMVHKDVQQFEIPMSCSISNPSQSSFKIPGPSYGLVDVSDSDDDSDEESDDDAEEIIGDINEVDNENTHPVFTLSDSGGEDGININLLDITDITGVSEVAVDNGIIKFAEDMNSDDKKPTHDISPGEIIEDNNADELNITVIHSETKHNGGTSATHHKSLHVNELRKMAVQLQLIQNVEAKKLKKDELVDLISKSTEAKQD